VRNNPLVLMITALLAIGACAVVDAASGRAETTGSLGDADAARSDAQAAQADLDQHKADMDAKKADMDARKADMDAQKADLDAQLATARAQLEEAAHQVAEISAKMSKPYMDDFMAFSTEGPPRAVIGVQLDTNSGNDGARIQEVSPGGPAAEAGLRVGDVIVSVNGNDVKGGKSVRQVLHQMSKVDPDSKVKLTVIRDGKPREFVVTARPGAGYYGGLHVPNPPLPPIPPMPPSSRGDTYRRFWDPTFASSVVIRGLGDLELVSLTPQLGSYFGTDKGVLVVRAPKEDSFKLEDGDVILAIDGREPTSGSHATRILSSYQPGEKVSLKVMRQHKTVSIQTTLPDPRGAGPMRESDRKVRLNHKDVSSTT
jgi:S1-C subfamily serine protease